MHRITRHFIATLITVTLFTCTGTIDGVVRFLQSPPHPGMAPSVPLTGLINFIAIALISLVVLAPVTSIASYLFTRKWSFPFYIQMPALVPLLMVYLVPWVFVFGRPFFGLLFTNTIAFTLPLLLYWACYTVLDREFFA